jgi:hypothetical protein
VYVCSVAIAECQRLYLQVVLYSFRRVFATDISGPAGKGIQLIFTWHIGRQGTPANTEHNQVVADL